MIEVEGLTVRYGGVTSLDGMSLTFDKGVCGLIGPNGAGKTTFFNVLSGFVRPAAGTVRAFGDAPDHLGQVAGLLVRPDRRGAARRRGGPRLPGGRVSEMEGRGVAWTPPFPPTPPQGRGTSDEGRRRLKAPRKRAGGRA